MNISEKSARVKHAPDVKYPPSVDIIRTAINPHFVGKVAKDAPVSVWGAFNNSFQPADLTLDELATTITSGYAITAVCRGKRKSENFIERRDLGLDFDAGPLAILGALQADPFVKQYAAIAHATSSHTPATPRARVLFILEQPIKDPNQYRAYAQALNWYFGTSDAQCFDPARVWFGALGCEVRKLGNVLPLAVLDELVTQWKATQPALTAPTVIAPTVDAYELLDQALREGRAGNRNSAGFELAKGLRDAGYSVDQARETMLDYQQAVERTGSHPYLAREATDSLASAYNHKPRIDVIIDALEDAVIAGVISIPANLQKTYFGILTIARKTGKFKDLVLALRSVEAACFGFVDKSTVANHIPALIELGLLKRERKSNSRKGSLYSLICVKVGHSHQETPPTAKNVQTLRICAQHYHELQAEPICAIRAQVHPLMARNDDELIQSFGASAQRILMVLIAQSEGFDSLEALQEVVFLSRSTVGRKVSYLAAHSIVDVVKVGTSLQVKLNAFWRENIDAITPALTSFGTDILRTERAGQQQIVHHKHMAFCTANADEKAMCEATIQRAEQKLKFLQAHKTERMNERRQWLQAEGIDPATAPPLSLHPRSNPKQTVKICLGSDQTKKHLPAGNNKTKLKALHNMKRRLTPGETAKVNQNRPNKVELAQAIESKQVIRIQLGDMNGKNFGTVEKVAA